MDNEQGVQLNNAQAVPDAFINREQFEHAQRVAKAFSASDLVPTRFKNNVANTMIALEMANRFKASPIFIMQNLYIVHGSPGWSGQFVISAINSCGKFKEDLDYEFSGEEGKDSWSCRAYTIDKSGKVRKGAKVSISMAKAEGWYEKIGTNGKNTSKWPTMGEQMLMYRAASFFGRVHCPEVLMGIYTVEEIEDITVMSDMNMDEYILRLAQTSSYDEDQRDIIRNKVDDGITMEEAFQIAQDLRDNQLQPVTHGSNYSVTEAKEAAKP